MTNTKMFIDKLNEYGINKKERKNKSKKLSANDVNPTLAKKIN
jgi:hypothetical protein